MKIYEFEITNWDKYQERADRPNYTWFKMYSEICESAFWHKTGHAEKVLFFFLLSQRNKGKKRIFFLRDVQLVAYCGIKEKDLDNHIDTLISHGVISEKSRQSAVFPREGSRQNVGSRIEKNREEKNTPDSANPVFDFESLYKNYPRKDGKSAGMKVCRREIRSQSDFSLLSQAIENYARECRREKTEKRFIKHFSSFMNCWRDYLESGKSNSPHPFAEILMGQKK